jgi:hypothetical protein
MTDGYAAALQAYNEAVDTLHWARINRCGLGGAIEEVNRARRHAVRTWLHGQRYAGNMRAEALLVAMDELDPRVARDAYLTAVRDWEATL